MVMQTERPPADLAEWKDQQANAAIFRLKAGEGSQAIELLKISDTNRIISVQSGQLLLLLRAQKIVLGPEYQWLADFALEFEKYQLTVGEPVNSRKSFAEVLSAEYQIMKQRVGTMWNRAFGAGGQAGGV